MIFPRMFPSQIQFTVTLQGRHVGLEREFHGIVIDDAHGIAIVGRVE
jgi:hypothetical protein